MLSARSVDGEGLAVQGRLDEGALAAQLAVVGAVSLGADDLGRGACRGEATALVEVEGELRQLDGGDATVREVLVGDVDDRDLSRLQREAERTGQSGGGEADGAAQIERDAADVDLATDDVLDGELAADTGRSFAV